MRGGECIPPSKRSWNGANKIVSFDRGFKFLGAVFLSEGAYLPFPKKRPQGEPPRLPPALTLKRYLELRYQG